MKPQLLDLVVCPFCHERFECMANVTDDAGNIVNGVLRCMACRVVFPIVREIPRILPTAIADHREYIQREMEGLRSVLNSHSWPFVDSATTQVQKSFEIQWNVWGEEKKIYGRTEEELLEWIRANLLPEYRLTSLYGKMILDAGCGHGVVLKGLAEHAGADGMAIGIDISGGIEVAHKRTSHRPNAHCIQTNLLTLPFRTGTFDLVLSAGVIPLTPNPELAFSRLARVCRPGGHVSVWVYPTWSQLWEVVQQTIRAVTTRLPASMLYYLCYIPVPLLSIFPSYSGTRLGKATWKQCALVIHDFYAPRYQTHHTEKEVHRWFLEEGFADIHFGPTPISAVGTKKSARPSLG